VTNKECERLAAEIIEAVDAMTDYLNAAIDRLSDAGVNNEGLFHFMMNCAVNMATRTVAGVPGGDHRANAQELAETIVANVYEIVRREQAQEELAKHRAAGGLTQ
jgi:hypothetical protein